MGLRVTVLCLSVAFIGFGHCQNFDTTNDAVLQEMINYAKQFDRPRINRVRTAGQPVVSSNPDEDHFERELYKEFLDQYHHLIEEQKPKAPSRTRIRTTTTTTESPFRENIPLFPSFQQSVPQSNTPLFPNTQPATAFRAETPSFPSFQQNPVQPRRPAIANAQPVPEPTQPSPRRRVVAVRRKSNNPETITPTLNKHQEPVLEATTFPSLKQKYFSIGFQTTQTTPTPIPQTTEAFINTPVPRLHITQNGLKPRINGSPKKPSPPETVPESRPETASKFDEEEFRRQSESAKYEFASDVVDGINGNEQAREEVRDGSAVKGKYSYSDGYVKRTVYYEADDKGYRVVKQEVEPLEGPHINPEGHAKVSQYIAGKAVNYDITKDDILKKDTKLIFREIDNVEESVEEN